MTELEMLEQAIQGEAVEAAPGAVQVLPGLCLLPAVVVVQELVNYPDLLKTEKVTSDDQVRDFRLVETSGGSANKEIECFTHLFVRLGCFQ